MRDCGGVRKGIHAHDFENCVDRPEDPETCLTLIGTERSYSLQLPSQVMCKEK